LAANPPPFPPPDGTTRIQGPALPRIVSRPAEEMEQEGSPADESVGPANYNDLMTSGVAAPMSGQTAPGEYRFSGLLGRGGHGEVWEGIQGSLGRVVAIKRVRPELRATLPAREARLLDAMFRREAMLTAALDHPNIVPIHDLGNDADGQPLLAMKHIRGRTWESILLEDFPLLSPEEYLAKHLPTLVSMTQAVAFAHARGIIHRDLKPSQVMVGDFGEVYLTDWGLALIVDSQSFRSVLPEADVSMFDVMSDSDAVGTPMFMAPEQAQPGIFPQGPWTDVFLLGGSLYMLLTGEPPRAKAGMMTAMIEIPAPEVRAPGRWIPQPLRQLVVHALEPDPRKRPQTARDFLDTLRDYVSGSSRRREASALVDQVLDELLEEPETYDEHAARLDALNKARALWPDHPRLSELRSSVLLEFARAAIDNDDLILARVQAERLDPGLQQAQLMSAIDAREAARRSAAEDLARAHRLLQSQHDRAEELLNFLLTELHQRLQPIGHLDMLDAIVTRVLQYVGSMDAAELSDAARDRKAQALRRVGEVRLGQGRHQEALEALDEALALAEMAVVNRPSDPQAQYSLAEAHGGLATLKRVQGDLPSAKNHGALRLATMERLSAEHPDRLDWLSDRGSAHYALADVHAVSGDLATATKHNEALRIIMRSLVACEHKNGEWRRRLAGAIGDHGWILRANGDWESAFARYREALRLIEDLVGEDPENVLNRFHLAFMHNKLAGLHEGVGQPLLALEELGTSRRILEDVAARDPANVEWRRTLAIAEVRAAQILEGVGRHRDARDHHQRAVDRLMPLARQSPRDVWIIGWLSRGHLGLGRWWARSNDMAEARGHYERAVALTSTFVDQPNTPDLNVVATHARGLLLLDQVDAARAFLKLLKEKSFRDPELRKLMEERGITEDV